eukprot:gnl/TRDRNA2_/TRDRNA2_177403_c0_seq2.p1 gnl/TRDRNA2_/TRDRNA2_177403_c0~~gnl/TRDRNA2_/TRDRNA2_177403_c0_seq2.p1  ORF type:complete len:321 (-),score=59.96 gnl/TRDRNA2_/TRDRNA2_177403_c0_seq2:56-1018(-)
MAALDAPLVKEAASGGVSGKAKALAGILGFGLGCVVLWSGGNWQGPMHGMPTMAWSTTSQFRGMSPAVQSAANTLRMYGVASGPMERLALTAIEASNQGKSMRDVTAMASRMDRNIQVWMSAAEEAVEEVAEEVKAPAPPPAPPAYSVKPEDMAGITAPLGYFDDWGLAAPIPDEKPYPGARLVFYRQAEIKHGRVGMLASLGIIVGEQFHPLFGGELPGTAVSQLQSSTLESFWGVLTVAIFLMEVLPNGQYINGPNGWEIDKTKLPGDLGWDPLGLKPKDPKAFLEMQNKELNNGRLGMLAAAGMIAQELVTGQPTFR